MENLSTSLDALKSLINEAVDEIKPKVLDLSSQIQFKKILPKEFNGFNLVEVKEGRGNYYALYSIGEMYVLYQIESYLDLVGERFDSKIMVRPIYNQVGLDSMVGNGVRFDDQYMSNLYKMNL